MKHKQKLGERRKYPRYYPEPENHPEVSFIFDNGEKISVEIVNISRGGVLISTNEIEHFLDMDQQQIKMIEIVAPNKKPFRCAGELKRLQPVMEEKKCFCAVEFSRIDDRKKQSGSVEEESPSERDPAQFVDKIFESVLQSQNYMKMKDRKQAEKIRQSIYDSFAEVTDHLTVEDRWWFYELLDEIKTRDPNFPDGLKNDFLKLCKIGLKKAGQKKK